MKKYCKKICLALTHSLVTFHLIPNFYLIQYPLGLMHFYFGISPLYLILVLIFLWRANDQKTYLWLHNLIKAWILVGVLSISLIHKVY